MRSSIYPEMNPFLLLLGQVLKNLPNNPKPACAGFCLTYFDYIKETIVSERIGNVPPEKEYKYFFLSTKKVTQTLLLGKNRSKDFQNKKLEQYPGAIRLFDNCAGVSGHDSMVDEATAALWLIVINYLFSAKTIKPMEEEEFWTKVASTAKFVQTSVAPDNNWIYIMGEMLKNEHTLLHR